MISQPGESRVSKSETKSSEGPEAFETFLYEHLDARSRLMLKYLTDQGLEHPLVIPAANRLEGMISYYNALAGRVSPASPRLIEDSDSEDERQAHDRNARVLTVVFIALAVLALVFTGLSLGILGTDISSDITSLADWRDRAWKIVFNVSVAALGAILSVFSQIGSFVHRNIYSKRYDTTYFAKLTAGIISGFILAELLSLTSGPNGPLMDFGIGAAALVGGTFAPVVYNIIKRLSEMTERVFSSQAEARESAVRKEAELEGALHAYRSQGQLLAQFTAYRTALEAVEPALAGKLAEVAGAVLIDPLLRMES